MISLTILIAFRVWGNFWVATLTVVASRDAILLLCHHLIMKMASWWDTLYGERARLASRGKLPARYFCMIRSKIIGVRLIYYVWTLLVTNQQSLSQILGATPPHSSHCRPPHVCVSVCNLLFDLASHIASLPLWMNTFDMQKLAQLGAVSIIYYSVYVCAALPIPRVAPFNFKWLAILSLVRQGCKP